jgi:drug/metabolite transporter (DMT)-like permease
MSWITIALLPPLFWSVANYLDKYVMTKAKADASGGAYGLLILSAAVSVVFALIATACIGIEPVQAVSTRSKELLLLSGAFEALYILFYFLALGKESATTVNVLFQFGPIFSLVLGFLFLQETLSPTRMLAIALILVGSLLVVKRAGERLEMRRDVVGLMLLACAFAAGFILLFKLGGGEEIGFWQAVIWQYFGIGVLGVLAACFGFAREDFLALLRGRGARMLTVTVGAEGANIAAIIATNAAVLVAPIGLVSSVASVQPIFVLLEGLVLARLLPGLKDVFETPRLTTRVLVGILLACVGGFLIVQ